MVIDNYIDNKKFNKMSVCKYENISAMLPSVLCPSYKQNVKVFPNSKLLDWAKYMIDLLKIKSLIIRIVERGIEVRDTFSSNIHILDWNSWENLINVLKKEIYDVCPILDCWCKPAFY